MTIAEIEKIQDIQRIIKDVKTYGMDYHDSFLGEMFDKLLDILTSEQLHETKELNKLLESTDKVVFNNTALSEPEQTEPDYKQMYKHAMSVFGEDENYQNAYEIMHSLETINDNTEIEKD